MGNRQSELINQKMNELVEDIDNLYYQNAITTQRKNATNDIIVRTENPSSSPSNDDPPPYDDTNLYSREFYPRDYYNVRIEITENDETSEPVYGFLTPEQFADMMLEWTKDEKMLFDMNGDGDVYTVTIFDPESKSEISIKDFYCKEKVFIQGFAYDVLGGGQIDYHSSPPYPRI